MIDNIAIKDLFGTGIDIHWYGVIIACGLLLGVILGVLEAKRRGYRAEMVLDFMLIAIPICIICARLYYVVFEWQHYAANPISILYIWNGGLAIYGAVIGGVIAAFIFFSWTRVRVGTMLDVAAPSLIIAQAIGRWGNFVNQEAYGNLITNPKWQWFPAAVQIEAQGNQWFQATFFYESAWNVIVFIVLMLTRKKVKVRGGVFALYLAGYGLGRLFIEGLRSDSLYWGPFRVSQVLSAVLIIAAVLYLVIMSRRKQVPEYKGVYDATLTVEQVNEFKANAKQLKAEEIAKRAQEKAEALAARSDAAEDKVKKAQEKADRAKNKLEKFETEIKLSEIKANVDDTATDKEIKAAEKAKAKAEKLEEKSEAVKEQIEKKAEKVKKAEFAAKKKELKAKEAEQKALTKAAKAKKAEIAAEKAAQSAKQSAKAKNSDK